MLDITSTLSGKGSQLNADDLSLEGRVIKITGAKVTGGEQPVALAYEGDLGKPFLPCLTMRRVLAHIWGTDAEAYVGRSLCVYREPNVSWGNKQVGGVRIKGASHIDAPVSYTATVSKGKRQTIKIEPLKGDGQAAQGKKAQPAPQQGSGGQSQSEATRLLDAVRSAKTRQDLEKITGHKRTIQLRDSLRSTAPDDAASIDRAVHDKLDQFEGAEQKTASPANGLPAYLDEVPF